MTQSAALSPTPTTDATAKTPTTASGSSPGATGAAVQLRAQLQGRDFAAQEAMLQPRAGSAGPVQRKVVQRDGRGGAGGQAAGQAPSAGGQLADASQGQVAGGGGDTPAATTAPPISYSVPGVQNVAAIANPVARNQAINQSYHAFDSAMSAYLGQPLVSNWCTYGQHASREAGAQIRNLQAAKGLIADIAGHLADFQSVALSATSPLGFITAIRSGWSIARRAWHDIKVIVGLLGEEGLVKQSVLLWMAKAGITQQQLTSIESRFAEIASLEITDIGLRTARTVYNTLVDVINMGIRLATAIPSLLTGLTLIYDNMCKGNREIYENVAPAYNAFLSAGLAGDGVVGRMGFGGETRGFLAAAFEKYSQVRAKANQLAVLPADSPERGGIATQRNATAHQANLLVGYQEQLVILQPIFDTMQVELAAMSGTMVLRDPNGSHPLTANWQDFCTRMGLDPARTPPLDQINADNLGELASPENRRGTISEYFEEGLTDRRIHNRPSNISEHG
jgi:hypothetical protein